MKTQCKEQQLEFDDFRSREVIGKFDGGHITSDGGYTDMALAA